MHRALTAFVLQTETLKNLSMFDHSSLFIFFADTAVSPVLCASSKAQTNYIQKLDQIFTLELQKISACSGNRSCLIASNKKVFCILLPVECTVF